jgi:hypothetical protein
MAGLLKTASRNSYSPRKKATDRAESRQRMQLVRIQAAGRTGARNRSRGGSNPGSRQNRCKKQEQRQFESRQRAEQVQGTGAEAVRIQAVGRTGARNRSRGSSNPGSRQVGGNKGAPARASPQRVVHPSNIQHDVSTCSIHAQPLP